MTIQGAAAAPLVVPDEQPEPEPAQWCAPPCYSYEYSYWYDWPGNALQLHPP